MIAVITRRRRCTYNVDAMSFNTSCPMLPIQLGHITYFAISLVQDIYSVLYFVTMMEHCKSYELEKDITKGLTHLKLKIDFHLDDVWDLVNADYNRYPCYE